MGTELFMAENTQGALSSISPVVAILSQITVVVLSIVGFGIVNFALIKNAVNALYWVAPKHWDKVDQVKRANLTMSNLTGAAGAANGDVGANNQVMQLIGSVASLMYSVLPNIKAMSDFGVDDNGKAVNVDPKIYFMKALPLAVVQIFIGVFVFNGYPAQVAETFSKAGTEVFDLVLANTDPVALVKKIPTSFAFYSLSTDSAEDDVSVVVNEAAKSAIKTYLGTFNDVQQEKRDEVALSIEAWLLNEISGDKSEYCNSDKYDVSITSQMDSIEIDMSRFNDVENDGVWQFAFRIPASSIESGTALDTSSKYLRVNMKCTPVASKGDTSSVECGMNVPSSMLLFDSSDGAMTIDLEVEEGTGFGLVSNSSGRITCDVKTSSGTVSANMEVFGASITITPKSSSDSISDCSYISNISGLKYYFGTSSHVVRQIQVQGNDVVFEPLDSDSGITTWSWGESPSKTSNTVIDSDEDEELEDVEDDSDEDEDEW